MEDEELEKLVINTQKILGKHIKKPPLTTKLLKKPPFRFLHDIVCVVIKEHGFLKGLYTEAELTADNVKEREAKIGFLTKLIDAVKVITKKEIKARPNKIVAGLEADVTNLLLQAIGYALSNKLDSKEYVRNLRESKIKETKSKTLVKTKGDKSSTRETEKVSHRTRKNIEDKRSSIKKKDRDDKRVKKERDKITNDFGSPREKQNKEIEDVEIKVKEPIEKVVEIKETSAKFYKDKTGIDTTEVVKEKAAEADEETSGIKDESLDIKEETTEVKEEPFQVKEQLSEIKEVTLTRSRERSDRPKSARPRSGDFKQQQQPPIDTVLQEVTTIREPLTKQGDSLILASSTSSVPNTLAGKSETIPLRPKSSLRPPSVRPSSARPGAPRLRQENILPVQEVVQMGKINVIVENFGDKQGQEDDEETVVIQDMPDVLPTGDDISPMLNLPVDKGHLVEQILEQINEDDVHEHTKKTVDINWEGEGLKNVVKEIRELRTSIQSLTRAANPLGKLLNYLQEDIEMMEHELTTWINMRKQITNDINKQITLNEDSIKPMETQMQELNDSIEKQKREIVTIHANIARNDARIVQLTERLLY